MLPSFELGSIFFDHKAKNHIFLMIKPILTTAIKQIFSIRCYSDFNALSNSKMETNMLKSLMCVAMVAFAAPAFAGECDPEQEATVGSFAAKVGKDLVSKVVPVTGKQMVSLSSCEARGGGFVVTYKYNFLGADGLYWVEIDAKLDATGKVSSVKAIKSSPNLSAAMTKTGVKL